MAEQRRTVSEDGLTAGQRLAASLSRGSGKPGGRSLAASVILHGLLAVAVLVGGGLLAEDLPEFETMKVRIVSPPPRDAGEPTPAPPEEAVVPVEITPEPETPTPPKPDPKPEPPVRKPEVKPETKPAAPPPPPEKKPAEQTSRGERPDPTSTGGENLNIVRDGQDFPFPDYLANIETQLYRYMRWDGSPEFEVQLAFAIERDGGVGSVDILRRSGNARFDLAAVNAVNVAARNGEFGPLPDAYTNDKLWVRFTYKKPQ